MTRPADCQSNCFACLRHTSRLAAAAAVLGFLCLPAASFSATTTTWHGSSGSNNWSTASNWSSSLIGAASQSLSFGTAGYGYPNPYDDEASGFIIADLSFASGAAAIRWAEPTRSP